MREAIGKIVTLPEAVAFPISPQSIRVSNYNKPVQMVIYGNTYEELEEIQNNVIKKIRLNKNLSRVESDYNIRVGRSRNALGPFLDKKGLDLSEGGGSLLLKSEENIRGPGHASIWIDNKGYFLAFHYYDSNRDGMSFHGEYNLLWVNGWPKINH